MYELKFHHIGRVIGNTRVFVLPVGAWGFNPTNEGAGIRRALARGSPLVETIRVFQ
jgi:hypothetical protein